MRSRWNGGIRRAASLENEPNDPTLKDGRCRLTSGEGLRYHYSGDSSNIAYRATSREFLATMTAYHSLHSGFIYMVTMSAINTESELSSARDRAMFMEDFIIATLHRRSLGQICNGPFFIDWTSGILMLTRASSEGRRRRPLPFPLPRGRAAAPLA